MKDLLCTNVLPYLTNYFLSIFCVCIFDVFEHMLLKDFVLFNKFNYVWLNERVESDQYFVIVVNITNRNGGI